MKKWIVSFISLSSFAFADQSFALNQLLYEIRKPETEPKEFRENLEKIGEYLGLEVFKELLRSDTEVETLTGASATHSLCDEEPVLVALWRAGVPLCSGVQKIFPNSPVGFFGISRDEDTLQPRIDYVSLPEVEGKTVLIIDTMIATGGSILATIDIVKRYGPKKIILISAIAAKPGIARIRSVYPDLQIFAAAIDPLLNDKGYIVPGLGDAGDRSYGEKMELD